MPSDARYGTTQRGSAQTRATQGVANRGVSKGSAASLVSIIFFPWIFFVIVICSYAFLHGPLSGVSVLAALVLAGVSGLLIFRGASQRNGRGQVFLGVMCLTAVGGAALLGGYVRASFMSEYWRLGHGAAYYNVLPSEPALGHSDATLLSFADGTRVDMSRSVGLADGYNDVVYCAAPIFNFISSTKKRVEYWAVGTDCCAARTHFWCDDAGSSMAKGGVVLKESRMEYDQYKKAVEAAEQQYDLVSSRGFLLLRWVKDTEKYRSHLFNVGMAWTGASVGAYLLLACVLGCTLHRLSNPPK